MCTHSFLRGGGGLNLQPIFQKGGGGLAGPQILEVMVLELLHLLFAALDVLSYYNKDP